MINGLGFGDFIVFIPISLDFRIQNLVLVIVPNLKYLIHGIWLSIFVLLDVSDQTAITMVVMVVVIRVGAVQAAVVVPIEMMFSRTIIGV